MIKIGDIDYKSIGVKGEQFLIEANQSEGFNFPYTLFIPENVDESTSLIVEGANTGTSRDDIKTAISDVIERSMDRTIIDANKDTRFPILTPCFPRINTKEDGGIYTHMLTSESLNYKRFGLERIDNQLVKMIKNAEQLLKERNINIDSKVILDGFSASAKFVNRFALLHPEVVKLVIAGACSGTGILPLKEIDGEKLLYPIGSGNIDEITESKQEAFKNIKQFYYMGTLDPLDNDPLGEREDGALISPSSITKEESKQLYKFIGKKMLPDRWENFQKIYKDLGVNATFKTYEGYGHTPEPALKDIEELLKQEMRIKTPSRR